MGRVIRKVFIAMTEQDRAGRVRIRREVEPAGIEEEVREIREKVGSLGEVKGGGGNFSMMLGGESEEDEGETKSKTRGGSVFLPKVNNRSLEERQKMREYLSNSDKIVERSGVCYSIGERMKNKERASLSCFMVGGFEIVDYSDSINQLHKRLLTKIRLNR